MSRAADNTLKPVYLFHGEEDFLIDEEVRDLIGKAVLPEQRGFNLDILDSNADMRDVIARASAYPMGAERRVVVLRDVDKLGKEELNLLAAYAETPNPTTVLILTAARPDMRRKLFAAVSKAGGAHECRTLTEAQVQLWIGRRFAARDRTIEPEAGRLLSANAGRGLRELDQEIEKLTAYADPRTRITADDVASVVGVSRQFNIFELQRAICAGEVARAEEVINRMIEAGNGLPYFTAMLSGFFVSVWRTQDFKRRGLSDTKIAAEFKRETWKISDQLEAAARYSPYEVERALALLLVADDRGKSGGDESVLLRTMIVEMMSGVSGQT